MPNSSPHPHMSDRDIDGILTERVAICADAGIAVSRETMAQLFLYEQLLIKWQAAINLVSRKTIDDVWQRHILDSLQLLKYLPPTPDVDADTSAGNEDADVMTSADAAAETDNTAPDKIVLADIGSGAGFPGLVLAIARPDIAVHLIESDQKKCSFLRTVSRETRCTNVTVHTARIEAVFNTEAVAEPADQAAKASIGVAGDTKTGDVTQKDIETDVQSGAEKNAAAQRAGDTARGPHGEDGPFVPTIVTARALAALEDLCAYTAPLLRVNPALSMLLLKGRQCGTELVNAAMTYDIISDMHESLTDEDGVILHIKSFERR